MLKVERIEKKHPDIGIFGKGSAGKSAHVVLDLEKKCVECDDLPEMTLDFDVLGELTHLAVCVGCLDLLQQKVSVDLKKTGKKDIAASFGINGMGRR